MSKSTFKILFYLKKNQVNKDGTVSIMVRLSVNGEVAQFSSKLNIDPKAWDVSMGKAAGNSMKARQLNELLDNMRSAIKNHYHDIELHEAFVTAEKVKNAFLGYTTKQRTLLELFKKHNEDAQKLVGISKTAATLAKYDRGYRRMEEFIKYQYNLSDIALKEINHMFITDFETYLRSVSKCNENTTAKFMQTFRMIVIIAKNNGWIFTDPFANYRIRLKRVDRGYLTDAELQKIMKKKFPTKRLEQVRDVFLFSCRQIVAHGIHRIASFAQYIILKITDKLFVELSESNIGAVELFFNQFGKSFSGVMIGRNCPDRNIHTDTRFQIVNQQV